MVRGWNRFPLAFDFIKAFICSSQKSRLNELGGSLSVKLAFCWTISVRSSWVSLLTVTAFSSLSSCSLCFSLVICLNCSRIQALFSWRRSTSSGPERYRWFVRSDVWTVLSRRLAWMSSDERCFVHAGHRRWVDGGMMKLHCLCLTVGWPRMVVST